MSQLASPPRSPPPSKEANRLRLRMAINQPLGPWPAREAVQALDAVDTNGFTPEEEAAHHKKYEAARKILDDEIKTDTTETGRIYESARRYILDTHRRLTEDVATQRHPKALEHLQRWETAVLEGWNEAHQLWEEEHAKPTHPRNVMREEARKAREAVFDGDEEEIISQ